MDIDEVLIKKEDIKLVKKRKKVLSFKIKRKKWLFFEFYCQYTDKGEKLKPNYWFKSIENLLKYNAPIVYKEIYEVVKINDDNYDVYLRPKVFIEDRRHEYSKLFNTDNELNLYVNKLGINDNEFIKLCT